MLALLKQDVRSLYPVGIQRLDSGQTGLLLDHLQRPSLDAAGIASKLKELQKLQMVAIDLAATVFPVAILEVRICGLCCKSQFNLVTFCQFEDWKLKHVRTAILPA